MLKLERATKGPRSQEILIKIASTKREMSVLSIDVCTRAGKLDTRQEVCSRRRDPKWPSALRLSVNGFNGVKTGFTSIRPRRIRRYAGSVCTALMKYALIVPPRLHVIITAAPSVLVKLRM